MGTEKKKRWREMSATKIGYCDLTLNPVVGCSKCSPGCEHCYAERRAAILARNPNRNIRAKYAKIVDKKGKWTGKVIPWSRVMLERLPRKAKRIFIGSMTDMFHENLDFGYVGGILYYTAREYPQHTFLLLTKRAHRLMEFHEWTQHWKWNFMPLPNVWYGVTVCEPGELWKIDELKKIPAAKRFVSFEPLLADMGDISPYLGAQKRIYRGDDVSGFLDYEPYIHWCICGGETGPNARPMHPDWVRSLRDQCVEAGVPFFFKSWGEWLVDICPDDLELFLEHRVGKRRAGRLLDGREWNEVPA
jgi:protein gp37